MDSTINPPSPLRKQDFKSVWYDSFTHGRRAKHHLSFGECTKHEGRQKSIFAQKKEVLCMQGIDLVFRIIFDDIRIRKDGNLQVAVIHFDPINRETAWKTCHDTRD